MRYYMMLARKQVEFISLGQYNPTHVENPDISALQSFKELCSHQVPSCKDMECWAGGDTGGWFGVP